MASCPSAPVASMPIAWVDTDTEQRDDGVARVTTLVDDSPPQPSMRHTIDATVNPQRERVIQTARQRLVCDCNQPSPTDQAHRAAELSPSCVGFHPSPHYVGRH